MRLLLDTSCWLWMTAAPERLSAATRTLLLDERTELYLSAASAWEMAIKYGLGKLQLPVPLEDYLPSRLAAFRTSPLAVEHAHALRVATLPAHHRDPFDRLLIAQAQIENLAILTSDRSFARYEVEIVPA
jgi:PIN domain nuclease of toxin-antitoxin system